MIKVSTFPCVWAYTALSNDGDEEGIFVFCTDERPRVSPYPDFLGGTKNFKFCPIDISPGPNEALAFKNSSTVEH